MQSEEPSIRWKIRVHVLEENPASPGLLQLQNEIKNSSRVKKLLSNKNSTGKIISQRNVYDKWQGAHWILATLADIGYPPGDHSLIAAKDQILDFWLSPHYYKEFKADKKVKAYQKEGVPVMNGKYRRCASQQGNALYMLLKLGLEDKRIDNLVDRLLCWQWPDGGWNCDKNPAAKHSSFMETLLPVRGLALYAKIKNDKQIEEVVKKAAEVFLKRNLFKSQRTGEIIHKEFTQLHYPLYWHYDILGGLKVMAEAGLINDPGCVDALDLLQSKMLLGGGWPAEGSYYKVSDTFQLSADYMNWGGASKYKMNEWITADALFVLKNAKRFDNLIK